MEIEEYECVSIEDGEIGSGDTGTNFWNTVLGPTDEQTVHLEVPHHMTVDQDEETPYQSIEKENEEEETKEPMSFELQQGYRILRELMAESNKSVNWHFLEAVDASFPETKDYYDRIKSPMWLRKMNDKFHERQYESITEFVADFRLMLENCFRYNGPDHYVSKRGQRLETMLEQKLALLSRDLREKTSIAATSGKSSDESFSAAGLRRRVKSIIPHDSSALLNHLREEELRQQREQRRQVIADRKAAQEAYLSNLQEWEDQLMGSPEHQAQLKAMWELPAIGHFLFLCQETLNLEEVAQYELERCFMMPRQSSTMQRVMSSLLSTPFQRSKLDKKNMMPYYVWEEKLRKRLETWYKMLDDSQSNTYKVAYKLGIDAFFFDVVGKKNPMIKKKFHELSFYRKVWIVKSICDNCVESQECLRDTIEAQQVEEQRSYVLGQDGKGNTYIHFPQFCGADLRVYRQDPLPEPEFYSSNEEEDEDTAKTDDNEDEEEDEVNTPPVKKRRVGRSAARIESKQTPTNRRSSRRREKPSDMEDTEPENTPSEVSTEPASRSLTATPEIVDELEEEVLTARRTRSGRSKRSLYQNGLTRELERSLRKLRRTRVNDQRSEMDDSPNVASDSDRDVSGANENHNNNNCVNTQNDADLVDRSQHISDSVKVERDETSESETIIKSECDSLAENEDMCDVYSVKSKDNDLCKESDTGGVKHCNGDSETVTCAITNGDISNGQDDSAGKKGNTEKRTGKLKECGEGSEQREGKNGEGSINKGRESDEQVVVVKQEAAIAVSTSAQIVENGAGGERGDTEGSAGGTTIKIKTERGDTEELTVVKNEDGADEDTKPDLQSVPSASDPSREADADSGKADSEGDEVMPQQVKTENGSVKSEDGLKIPKTEPMEEEEDSEDELTPEMGQFELVADSVEDLRLLTEKFAEPAEPPAPVSTRGKKSKLWRASTRKRCEVDLYERLAYLLKELEPWEAKLLQARRKAQVKMRKELDEYKEEDVKPDEDWNTEDSSSDEEAETVGGGAEVKEEEGLECKVKKSSHPPSVVSTDSRDSLLNNQDDEYEIDVSSRGRLRKRRVIPNNIEDQGIKKKKVAKPGEEISVHLPNILQKQLKPSTGLSLTAGNNTNATTTMHNMSASQILRMSILNQSQGKTSLIPSSVTNIRLAGVGTGVSVTQSSHPVIQSLLTTRGQPITTTGLRQVRPKPVMMTSLKAPTSGAGPTVSSPGKATLEVTGGNTPSSTQKILNSLPASVIQQLLKHKAIKIQTTGPGGTTLFLTSAVPTSSAITSNSQQTTTASPIVPQLAVQSSAHAVTPVSSIAVAQVKTEDVTLTTVASQPQLQPVQSAAALLASQLNIVTSPTSSVVTPSQTALGSVPSTATQNPVIIPIQGSNHTSPSSTNTSPLQATETSHTDIIHRPYIFPAGYSPPPKPQKYASNVTVKALLENRASMKAPDPSTGLTRADLIENLLSVSVTKDGSSPLSNVILSKVAGPPAPGQFKPRVLKLPSQEALDNALQSVVTSVSTSLPTANIKVPSAVTLPSIQPRRNVTKTIQSMKAPIPVTHKVGSTPPSTLTTPSNLTQSASKSAISSLTQVTKSPIKTGFVVQTPTSGSGSGQKNMLLKVVPQNFLTSQGLVQGYLTPQGLVIPQNKQTTSVPSTLDANVTFTSTNLIKDTPIQAKQVVVTQAPKQIQLSFSPVKQAVASSIVPQVTPVVDLQQISKGLTKISTAEVIPQQSPSQSQASLTSTTQTTASKLSKGVKPSQIQTKVATPAAELVKQIAAGQSSIHGTRMMVPSANQLIQGKLAATGLTALRTPVSGAQASVIPALMVGQPAVASPLSPRLILPPQQLTGTPLLPIKSAGTTSESANKPSVVPTSLQLAGKSPSTPFVLSLGSGLQNVILSPNKDLTSQPVSQLQAPSLQLSIPQTVVKTTAVTPNVASLQLPVQSMPLNQQVLKLTPQQLASGLVTPQTGTGVVQLIQQQVSGATSATAPKQVLISPQQVGALSMAVAPGVKMIAQQPGTPTIPALINKAAPQVLHQKMTTLQVAPTSRQAEGKAPVILQQQVLPLSAGTTGQIVQVGQQQLLINKSIPQQSIVASQSLPAGLAQPSIRVLQPGGNIQQSPVMQLPGNVSVTSVPQPSVTPVTTVQCSTVKPTLQIATPGTMQTAAAQPATKAALQAHLNQTKQTIHVPGSKTEMPTLSTMLGHEKGKVITSLNTSNLTPQKQVVKATENQITLSNLNAVTPAANVSIAVPPGTSTDSGNADGQAGKQQKLLLYNIGGQLMTAQGVPVTVEQGVLKVIPQATIQIGNQMLTIKSPSSAMVENPSVAKSVTSTPASVSSVTSLSESNPTTVDLKPSVASVPSSNSNILIQANIQSAAGFTPSVVKTKTSPEPKLLKTDIATKMPYITKSVPSNSADLLTLKPVDPTKPVVATPGVIMASPANSVSSSQMVELANKATVVTSQFKHTDASKPVLQKTGSREEAALNLLSLANISER